MGAAHTLAFMNEVARCGGRPSRKSEDTSKAAVLESGFCCGQLFLATEKKSSFSWNLALGTAGFGKAGRFVRS